MNDLRQRIEAVHADLELKWAEVVHKNDKRSYGLTCAYWEAMEMIDAALTADDAPVPVLCEHGYPWKDGMLCDKAEAAQ